MYRMLFEGGWHCIATHTHRHTKVSRKQLYFHCLAKYSFNWAFLSLPFTFSLMNSHMMRVISSPSISTTGWSTLMRRVASETFTILLSCLQCCLQPQGLWGYLTFCDVLVRLSLFRLTITTPFSQETLKLCDPGVKCRISNMTSNGVLTLLIKHVCNHRTCAYGFTPVHYKIT